MVLNQQSQYQASFRKWTYQAPEPKSTHQHFALSSLGSTSRTEWFLPLCGGQSRPNSWQRAVMLWKLWQLKFPSLWLHSVVQDSKKNKRLLPVWVCAFLHPSIPLRLQPGLHQVFPPFWPRSVPGHSKDHVQGWRDRERESKYTANAVAWGITNGRFAKGLIASERH